MISMEKQTMETKWFYVYTLNNAVQNIFRINAKMIIERYIENFGNIGMMYTKIWKLYI